MAKGSGGRGHTLEIKQKDKQFSPQVAVVQKGTSVSFPNLDAVFHSVFSTSGRNSFDLGSYRSGDPARSVDARRRPGVVEVFCNIHAKMNAAILVVPGPLYTKVASDGSFRLENVPVGARRIVAWTPNAKPVQQKVEVTSGGAQVDVHAGSRGSEGAHEQAGTAVRLVQRMRSLIAAIDDTDPENRRAPVRSRCPGGCGRCRARAAVGGDVGGGVGRQGRDRGEAGSADGRDRHRRSEAGPGARGQGGGRDPAAAGGAGRRGRRGHHPGSVRQRRLVGAVPRARRRAGRGEPRAGGARRQGREEAAAARGADARARADRRGRLRRSGRRRGDHRRRRPGRREQEGRCDVPDAGAAAGRG